MPSTPEHMSEATAVVGALLEALDLSNYVFEVEPREDLWEVRVECSTREDAWQRTVLEVEDGTLQAARTEGAARERLLAAWGTRLRDCRPE
ncbi:MAG: hypothetical protein ACQEXJ_04885 [Myxococcota bacterium]